MKKRALKTLLRKETIKDSFYGVLNVSPEAENEQIVNAFKLKIKSNLSLDELKLVLKSYGILSSSYKKQYDEYLNKVLEGIDILVDELENEDILIRSLKENFSNNSVLPEDVFMQPWATSI